MRGKGGEEDFVEDGALWYSLNQNLRWYSEDGVQRCDFYVDVINTTDLQYYSSYSTHDINKIKTVLNTTTYIV